MPLKIIPDVIDGMAPLVCIPNSTVTDAALLMQARSKGAVLVADKDVLVGIFTERDVTLRVVVAGLKSPDDNSQPGDDA